MSEQNNSTALTKEQKVGVALLLVFALLAMGLGAMQVRNNIYRKFALNSDVPSTIKDQVNTPEALSYRDTDHDGLNDFDELYVYNTSPYLVDTDSDGVTDKQELDAGADPLCAKGSVCVSDTNSAAAITAASATATAAGLLPAYSDALNLLNTQALMFGQLADDPAKIRVVLEQAGMNKDVLSKMTDAELRQAALQALGASGQTEPAMSASNTAAFLQALPAELKQQWNDPQYLRQLLLTSGMDQATLDALSDAEIMQAAAAVLNAANSKNN